VALAADAKRGSWLPIVVFLAAIAPSAALAVTGTINLNAMHFRRDQRVIGILRGVLSST